MVNTINDNFQKVFTLPFLKGDDGDMISTEFCSFWVQDNEGDYLTQEGAKIFNTIFETDKFYYEDENVNRMTYENFKDVLIDDLKLYSVGNSYNDISLFTNLYGPDKDPKILLFYKIQSEDGVTKDPLGSAQLYYYFDPRISKLSELITISNNGESNSTAINYRQDFKDYTCILSTRYDSDGNYTYEKQSGWPTLYFDNSSKQFCWSINGQPTGVNAQGVNGKDGIGARIWICQVELDTNNSSQVNYENGIMSQFTITKVFVPKDSGWSEPGDDLKSYLGETNYFQQGDMAVCYLPNSENNYSDQIIGVINQNSSDKTFFVQASISQNTTNTFKNLSLFNLLSSIGTGENDTPTTKGIFIPTTVGNNTSAHTLYEGNFNGQDSGLYLVNTKDYNTIKFDGGQILLENNNIDFNVYYNTNIYGKLNVYDTTILNSGLTIIGGATISGAVELNDSLTVGGTTKLNGGLNIIGGATISGAVGLNDSLTVGGTTTLKNKLTVKDSVTAKVNGIENVSLGVPIGSIVMWAAETAPEGWTHIKNPIDLVCLTYNLNINSWETPIVFDTNYNLTNVYTMPSTSSSESQLYIGLCEYRVWQDNVEKYVPYLYCVDGSSVIGNSIKDKSKMVIIKDEYIRDLLINTYDSSKGEFNGELLRGLFNCTTLYPSGDNKKLNYNDNIVNSIKNNENLLIIKYK